MSAINLEAESEVVERQVDAEIHRPGPPAARRMPVRYFARLVDALQASGVDTLSFLRKACFEDVNWERPDAALLPDDITRILIAARSASGRSDIGFELGRLMKATSHGTLGLGLISSPTVGEMMSLASRHFHLITELFTLRFERTANGAIATYLPMVILAPNVLHALCEAIAVAHVNMLQITTGTPEARCNIRLSAPIPDHLSSYLALGTSQFHFDAHTVPGVHVTMNTALLNQTLPFADISVMRQVDQHCRTLGRRPPSGGTGWGEYIKMIVRDGSGPLLTLEELARRTGISARTITRNLGRERLQFRTIVQAARFERACDLLLDPRASVVSVAEDLGFTDPGNFGRAFRREVGVPPGEYQRRAIKRMSNGVEIASHARRSRSCRMALAAP